MSATKGYFMVYRRVLKLKLTPDEFSLYVFLLSHDFNKENPHVVFPSYKSIMKHLKMSRQTISNNLWCLHDMGLITIRQVISKYKAGKFEYYLPNIEELDDLYFQSIIDRINTARKFKQSRIKLQEEKRYKQRGNSKKMKVVSIEKKRAKK